MSPHKLHCLKLPQRTRDQKQGSLKGSVRVAINNDLITCILPYEFPLAPKEKGRLDNGWVLEVPGSAC